MNTISCLLRTLDLIVPERCVGCGTLLCDARIGPAPVCADCVGRLKPLVGSRCSCCGVPLISEEERCLACREREHVYGTHRSIYGYDAAMAALIGAYKSRGIKTLGVFFAEILRREWERSGSSSVVVPVPGNPAGVRRRGWDHCSVIAEVMARRYRVPVRDCLKRSPGRRQKELGYAERQRNLSGKIAIREGRRVRVDDIVGAPVTLIDDVYTTGATVEECAHVLRGRGAGTIDVLTIAMDL